MSERFRGTKRKIMRMRKRDSPVCSTEPFNKNAILAGSACEDILFNYIAVQLHTKGNRRDRQLRFTSSPQPVPVYLIRNRNKLSPFASFK